MKTLIRLIFPIIIFVIVYVAMGSVEQSIDLRYTPFESAYITTVAVAGLISMICVLVCILTEKHADFAVALLMFCTMNLGILLTICVSKGLLGEPAPLFILVSTLGMAGAGMIGWFIASFSDITETQTTQSH